MPNLYLALNTFKDATGHKNAVDDTRILAVLDAISRQTELRTGNRFYSETRTRVYTARESCSLLVDNLLAVTSLKTDGDGDRTYEDTWAATDYDLDPANALYESPPAPYWEICTTPDGDYRFPVGVKRGVQVVGRWGYYEVLEVSDSLLNGAIASTTATTITVDDGPRDFSIGHTLLIDSEQIYVRNVVDDTLTVTRGVNGTTPATHADDAAISIYTYPIVSEAVLLQASRILQRKDAPFGVTGSAELGTIRITGLDLDVRQLLEPVSRIVVG